MRVVSILSIILLFVWIAMTVALIWGLLLDYDLYWRATTTMALIGGGLVIAALITREYKSEKKLKDDNFID